MENMKFCQSCAMPLNTNEDCGTEKDGSKSQDYCHYCYVDGKFAQDITMAEMIDFCVPMVSNGNPYKSEQEARAQMNKFFSELKRWKK